MKTIITFLCLFIIGTVLAQRKPIAALVVLDSIPLVEPQLRVLFINIHKIIHRQVKIREIM